MGTALKRLARKVGREVSDPVFLRAWDSLQQERGYTEEDLTTAADYTECALFIRERIRGQTLRGQPGTTPAWVKHAFVLSDRLAEKATDDPGVAAFRKDVLNNHLIECTAVPEWMRLRTGNAWPPLAFLERGHTARVLVAGNNDLERLLRVVEQLVQIYQWHEAQATHFVLTDQTPLRWPIRVVLMETSEGLNTVQLTVDPWVPVGAVISAYQWARRELQGRTSRPPRITDKGRALAAFEATYDGGSARTRLKQWNRAHPTWRYADVRHFVRDLRRAAARL